MQFLEYAEALIKIVFSLYILVIIVGGVYDFIHDRIHAKKSA